VASLRTIARPVAAVAAALLAAGCATVPTVGAPQPVKSATGQAQPFVQPIPPAPAANWTPQDIVAGFLAASASLNDPAAARRFLAASVSKTWHINSAVTVLSGQPQLQQSRLRPNDQAGASTEIATVSMTGHQLATISQNGVYINNPGSPVYTFELAQVDDQWLITGLPHPVPLLLTQSDFQQVYQPRNLYFWSPNGQVLVPEPVFAPQHDTYASVPTVLVNGLLLSSENQSSWLEAATTTAFPRGTTLTGVTITGSTATVNLGGAATRAGPRQLLRMAQQVVATLTSTSYGQLPIARSVVIEINGQPQEIGGHQVQQPAEVQSLIPGLQSAGTPTPLYYVGADHAVSEVSAGAPARVLGPAGRGQIPFTSIAVSAGSPPQLAGSTRAGQGCAVYYGSLAGAAALGHTTLPDPASGPCTSLSWDSEGDIWAVAGQNIWVLPPGGRRPVAVSPPPLPGSQSVSYRVLSLLVAPDGVRVAMLIRTTGGRREVLLTAISRSGTEVQFTTTIAVGSSVAGPTAVSWYDDDDLLVLAGSQLQEVPATGDAATPVGPVPAGTAMLTSAGPGQIATASRGWILTSSGPDQSQQRVAKGTSPAYPG
jgi:Lipoprotein LpqB beta-propeller domain/Sporulation and spore germination